MEQATFAAGCFWGVEAAFRKLEGVNATEVGYCGGTYPNPTYREVCGGETGHAEALRVTFDPAKISYEELLAHFWGLHDPTSLDRQGPDIGSQYRSAIFTHDAAQQAAAQASKDQLEKSGRFRKAIVTEIQPAATFTLAEDYHQQYIEKRSLAASQRA